MIKKEKILRIEECNFKKSKDDWNDYEGYQIITDKQTIKIGMTMDTSCCERPGYFWSVDKLDKFVGANLNKIEIVDETINKKRFDKEFEYGFSEGGIMYVNFETDKGLLQFTAYNQHNGYYGHNAIVMSEQLEHEEGL